MSNVQDYSAVITWTSDWLRHLAWNSGVDIRGSRDEVLGDWVALGSSALSIIATSVECDDSRVSIGGGGAPTGGYQVVFDVAQAGITKPTTVTLVVRVTLSNGDTDERNFPIQFTNT